MKHHTHFRALAILSFFLISSIGASLPPATIITEPQKSTIVYSSPILGPIVQAVYNHRLLAALTVTTVFALRQYYLNKKRPSDDQVVDGAYQRRFNEILYGHYSIQKKIKLLVELIDDLVVGRRPKEVEEEFKMKYPDGNGEVSFKEKRTVIKGTGLIHLLNTTVFAKLDDLIKFLESAIPLMLILDATAGGNLITLLNNFKTAKYELPKDKPLVV